MISAHGAPRWVEASIGRVTSVGLALPEELLEGEELAYRGEEPAREARTAPLPAELDPRVRDAIGVPELYAHQLEAWEAAARGEHLVVTTGTASGKTLAFNLPVLDALARDAEEPGALPLPDRRRSPRISSGRSTATASRG